MKKTGLILPVLTSALLLTGCIVETLEPWLSEESLQDDPGIVGCWQDAKGRELTFTKTGDPASYDILLSQNDEKQLYTATLHRIDEQEMLNVRAVDNTDATETVSYLLLKVVLEGDAMKLLLLDTTTFEERVAKTPLKDKYEGDPVEAFAMSGSTSEQDKFVRANLADPTFFDPEPLYDLTRKKPDQ